MGERQDKTDSTRRGLDFETVGSIVAILVAIAALWVSWQETSNTRKERLASALPIMETGVGLFPGDELALRVRVENAGVGSALVYSARFTLDGEPVESAEAFQQRVLKDRLRLADVSGAVDGIELKPVPAGKTIYPLDLRWNTAEIADDSLDELLPAFASQRVSLELCFCDVYKRCWVTKPKGFPETIDDCPAPTGFPSNLLTAE